MDRVVETVSRIASGADIMLSSALGTRSGVKAQAQCGHYVHDLKLPVFGLSFQFTACLGSRGTQEELAGALLRASSGLWGPCSLDSAGVVSQYHIN